MLLVYCKFGNFLEVLFLIGFVKIKPSRNGEITLSLTHIGVSFLCREFLMSKICLLTPFAKMNISRKFPNLPYHGKI